MERLRERPTKIILCRSPIMQSARRLVPVAVNSDGYSMPTNFVSVTNLCFWGIHKKPHSVSLGLAWPAEMIFGNCIVDLYSHWQLASNGWTRIAEIDISEAVSNAVIEIDANDFPTNAMESSAFFRVALQEDSDGDGLTDGDEEFIYRTNSSLIDSDGDGLSDFDEVEYGTSPIDEDSDGDGIADGDEMGYINKCQNFEWHNTSGFSTTYGVLQDGGLHSYFGAVSAYAFPNVINITELPLIGAVSFENGSSYLYSSGRGGGWVFPELVEPLSQNTYDMGDLLVAPYWISSSYIPSNNTNSYIRSGFDASGSSIVIEYHNVYIDQFSNDKMSYQIIVPLGTSSTIKISYNASDSWIDGVNAIVGIQNKRIRTAEGYYNLSWDFDNLGPILPFTTIEYHLGYGTNPQNLDSDGDGLTDDFEVFNFHSDPLRDDSDNDGLTDNEELSLSTNPMSSDSDSDGLPDIWEVSNNLNPLSAAGNDGRLADIDDDGLNNIQEYRYGTNPILADSDSDGLLDSEEILLGTNPCSSDSDSDGLYDKYEIERLSDPNNPDSDYDGVEDGLEVALGLDVLELDSDGDGMNDGWEYVYRNDGFNPAIDNSTDTNPDNDIGADPDGDGLANGKECEWRSNPSNEDTDCDGVNDGVEVGQNSDPADPSDMGLPNTRIPVSFYFGDPSASHSEKYRLDITPAAGTSDRPMSFSWLNANYGECETRTAMLKAGWKYEVRLTWAACNHSPDGSIYPNYDYTLSMDQNVPQCVVLDDPNGLFRSNYYGGEYYGASHFPILDAVATITVYEVTGVTICKPDDSSWTELEASRVLLDDEALLVKVEVTPQISSLDQCRQMFGGSLIIKTSGTCPAGSSVPISDDAALVALPGRSEIRISKTRQQLKSLGLLPVEDEDGINEMAWYDAGDDDFSSDSNLSDSSAFSEMGYQFRGKILNPSLGDLNTSPPVSINSESFYKSAGCEIITAEFGGVPSARRQIMNQADYFYYSGHGRHSDASLEGLPNGPMLTPSLVTSYWNRDLKCVVFAGCSVLDIKDFNGNYAEISSHTSSPGKKWAKIDGPDYFLGYAYYAPLDTQGADIIASKWVANRDIMDDAAAWMKANDNRNGRNACAIQRIDNSHVRYYYFMREKGFLYNSYILTNVIERIEQ